MKVVSIAGCHCSHAVGFNVEMPHKRFGVLLLAGGFYFTVLFLAYIEVNGEMVRLPGADGPGRRRELDQLRLQGRRVLHGRRERPLLLDRREEGAEFSSAFVQRTVSRFFNRFRTYTIAAKGRRPTAVSTETRARTYLLRGQEAKIATKVLLLPLLRCRDRDEEGFACFKTFPGGAADLRPAGLILCSAALALCYYY